MIIDKKKYRFTFIFIVLFTIIVVFIFRLAQLQIVQGDYYADMAQNQMVRKITETAPRGSIYTNDGYEIARNKIGYSVELIYSNIESGKENQVFLKLYNILKDNGEEIDDQFPILLEDGEFTFSYVKDEEKWKSKNSIPKNATADDSLKILRDKYNVKDEVSDGVALEAIEKVYMESDLPITLKDGKVIFTYENNEIKWKKDIGFKEEGYNLTAEESFNKLRKQYEIDSSFNDGDARKIMVFKEMVRAQGFRSWDPIQVATNVKLETVFDVDANMHNLSGVTVVAKPVREYPYKSLASHVIGYIGKVNESDVESGNYKMNDLKGISGIEYAFEEYLKGEDGERFAVTDYKGRPQNDPTKEVIDPTPGGDAILTIDYDLQKSAEEALEKTNKVNTEGSAPHAKSGAVVALDVNTGAVLAMASYPDYDPNLFSNGISTEDWDELNVLVDDPLYPKPLYNNASMSALQPGSTFKPLMAVSGLEEGVITRSSTIYCRGVHPIFTQFSCLSHHGSETVREAIKDSCNVFFYETGYRLGVDNIQKYAQQFGLGEKTGLEISESAGYLATKEDKKQTWTYSTSDYIRETIGIKGTAVIVNDQGEEQEVYKSYAIAKEMFAEIDFDVTNTYGDVFREVSRILAKYNVKEANYLHRLTQYVLAGRWVTTDTINASIGQGGNSLTPMQLANYLATLVNGGINRETYLVEKIVNKDGETEYQHEENIKNKLDLDTKNVEEVKKGMKDVAMYSTGRRAFAGFDHNGIGVGGKTGTAQYGSSKIDDTGWFMAFAPYDDPEIVVVAMIIQGHSSSNSVPVVREVLDTYFYNNYDFGESKK